MLQNARMRNAARGKSGNKMASLLNDNNYRPQLSKIMTSLPVQLHSSGPPASQPRGNGSSTDDELCDHSTKRDPWIRQVTGEALLASQGFRRDLPEEGVVWIMSC